MTIETTMMRNLHPRNLRPGLAVLALMIWGAAASALALEANQVRGRITDVNLSENRLQLEVSEAGEERSAREGRTVTYQLDEDTEIRLEDPRTTLIDPSPMTLDDLEPGTMVVLDFDEVDGRRMARNVSVEDDGGNVASAGGSDAEGATGGETRQEATDRSGGSADMAAMESDTRSELPSTASILPLLAWLGIAFGGVAALMRIRRRL